jgi:eukaryotic-like serine/threonine-protein kinase
VTAQARVLGGRYEVGELLGFGGMAEVHRGRDNRLGRDVAIKTLRHDLARDATFQLRFRREAQNAASLNHPAIVAVYDTGEEHAPTGEELPYIVMEFVNGRTLKEILGHEGRLMPRRALEITADICSALDFSHRHQIIHRDIKPGNVMLTQTGQVKVMDFGIARALASEMSAMTQTSAVIGTAQYLSPEQARGEQVDARSDVYATGCVLFELLTGQPPFVGDNPVSVAYQHVREDPRPPSDLNPDVPPAVDAIVLKALAKNPANRYQSAGEMRADVLRAAAGRPVSATPVFTESERTAMLAPPRQPMAPPQRPVARVADRRRQRSSATLIVVMITVLGMLAFGALGLGLYLANRNKNVAVPNLIGKTSTDAQKLLSDRRLRFKEDKAPSNCDQTKANKVVTQDPVAETSVAEGSEVRYEVCFPPGKTSVPDLIGKTKGDAEKLLKERNLNANFVPTDSEKPVDTVVGANPAPGNAIAEGGTVTVNVSKGNQRLMPDLSGYTEGEAKLKLKEVGLDPGRVTVRHAAAQNDGDVGHVFRQDPAPGKAVATNTTITITIGDKVAQSPPPSPPTSPSPSSSKA